MNYKITFLFLGIILLGLPARAQVKFQGEMNFIGLYSNEENSPFWFYTNKRGRISEETSLASWISGTMDYRLTDKTSIEVGGGLLFENGLDQQFFTDEIYAQINHSWFSFIAGKKHSKDYYNSLSAVNENILWSLNAQPLPGIQFETNRPVYFSQNKKLGFEASWNEYFMGRQESVRNTKVHHKSLHLILNLSNEWSLKAGIQHIAQWGGDSEIRGKQPTKFSDYLKIVTGRGGGENAIEGEQINVLGNHLGSYEVYLNKATTNYNFNFFYNSIFEDGSGSRLANFPDGRYGLRVSKNNKNSLINDFLYEFYYTKNQSQTFPHLYDNYFNHYIYSSGWTYHGRVIGVPFLTTNYWRNDSEKENISVWNNSVLVHHFGLSGNLFGSRAYKLLFSYRNNGGIYRNIGVGDVDHYPADDDRGFNKLDKEIVSTYLDLELIDNFFKIHIILGMDLSETKNNFGAGILLKKQL